MFLRCILNSICLQRSYSYDAKLDVAVIQRNLAPVHRDIKFHLFYVPLDILILLTFFQSCKNTIKHSSIVEYIKDSSQKLCHPSPDLFLLTLMHSSCRSILSSAHVTFIYWNYVEPIAITDDIYILLLKQSTIDKNKIAIAF